MIKVNALAIILLANAVMKGLVFRYALIRLINKAKRKDAEIPIKTPTTKELEKFAPIIAKRAAIKVNPSNAIFKVPLTEVIIAPKAIKNNGVNEFKVLLIIVFIIFFSH